MALKITKNYLTKNRCYIKGETCPKIGIQIHTIGTGQGTSQSVADYWNQSIVSACVHYCVDADVSGKVLQFLPESTRSWADAGWGNDNLITIEICESDYIRYTGGANYDILNVAKFQNDILRGYRTAVELCANICRRYGWNPKAKLSNGMYLISSHKEGNLAGLSSNHGDPNHVWDRFGLTMDGFRKDVAAAMKTPEIKPSMVLKTTQRIPLRTAVTTKKKKAGYVKYKKLKSAIAKKKCRRTLKGNAVMKKGRKFVIQEVKTNWKGDVWVRIKIAGAWLPVCVGGKWRVEVV